MKKIFALVLIFIFILTAMGGCSEQTGGNSGMGVSESADSDTSNPDDNKTESAAYAYPNVDYKGEEINILNAENIWDFYMDIDVSEMTGDSLDDIIYTRNRSVEERLNFKLAERKGAIDQLATITRTSILAGENAYQIAFIAAHTIPSLVTEKYLVNLLDVPEIQLEENWWDKSVVEEGSIGKNKALYFANSDFHLSGLDGTWCMFFNEDMMADLGLGTPYQLVRDGKWTFDRLSEYAKAAMNLNGDDSFKWNADGKCIYGYTSFDAASAAMIFSSGERFVKKDNEGNPYFSLNSERYFTVADKIAQINGTEGEYISANDSDPSPHNYIMIFKASRALFIGGEIKLAPYMRNVEFTFGLVPFPKYEEAQNKYCSMMFYQVLLSTIPITNPDVSQAGTVLDVMSYEARRQVLPVYYDVYLSQKGLRNEESIEMLGLITTTRYFNMGCAYGWVLDFYNALRGSLDKGETQSASLIEKYEPAIVESINKTMALLNG